MSREFIAVSVPVIGDGSDFTSSFGNANELVRPRADDRRLRAWVNQSHIRVQLPNLLKRLDGDLAPPACDIANRCQKGMA